MKETGVYAGLWPRILAFALDYLIIGAYLVLFTAVALLLRRLFPGLLEAFFSNPRIGQLTGFLTVTLPVSLYFALLEASPWQGTWGKRKMHLRVVSGAQERISLGRSIARTTLKFVPWELAHTCIWQISFATGEPSPLILAGFILVWILVGANLLSLLVSTRRQTIYDWLAGTCVVRAG